MNFCSHCGANVKLSIPAGDTLHRHVCVSCGTIHYQNPKIVVGTIPIWQNKVLLCKRAIEPRYGYWTLPAGFMENGEATTEGAIRETLEEACARVELRDLYTLIDIPHINQVHLLYLAQLTDLDFGPGTESLEVALFAEEEIPWNELAFRSVSTSLQHYFADRQRNRFNLHRYTLLPPKEL